LTESLREFAKRELWLKDEIKTGGTRQDNLETVWRQTGKMPPELAPVEVPDEALYLWGYFISLSSRRSGNGYSANPISNVEIQAWQRLSGVELLPWELDVIDMFEQVYLAHYSKRSVT